ncbi:MAG: hypothetical protein ACOC97_01235 [Myxococcota bacterium]
MSGRSTRLAAGMALATTLVATLAGRPASAQTMLTNTEHVEDLALDGATLWVATHGGLERYDLARGERTRVFTTLDGLDHNHVRSVAVQGATVQARTSGATCMLEDGRFRCAPGGTPFAPRIAPADRRAGHRVTRTLERGPNRYVGTAGGGVFVVRGDARPRRLTPEGQICGNHVTDVVGHGGRTYVGTFADGLCVTDGEGFRRLETPFRMVNDLESTPHGLFVVATEGAFRSRDGVRFERAFERQAPGAANGLAFDGTHLWMTTPAAVFRMRLRRGDAPSRAWWRPGGSTAVQDVAVAPDGAAWVATEDRGAVRIEDDAVRVLDRAAGLPSSWALVVDAAPGGSAVVGTLRHGAVRIEPDGTRASLDLPDPWLLRVRAQDGRLYLGTQGGAFVMAGDRLRAIPHVPDPRVHEIREIDGRLWVGTEGGTLVTDPGRAVSSQDGTRRRGHATGGDVLTRGPVREVASMP